MKNGLLSNVLVKQVFLSLMWFGSFQACESFGLILTGKGNAAVQERGWPTGALAVANLETRSGWAEGPPFGGGQWTFFYRGGTDALQKTLMLFSEIQSERLEVVLHEGGATSPF